MDEEEEPSAPGPDPEAWMLSFGDLVSLMLVFFVMLFSMSTLEQEEFEAIVSALAQQFNPASEMTRPKPSVDMDIPKIDLAKAYSLDYLRTLLGQKMADDPVLKQVVLHQLHDRLVISLPSDDLFDVGGVTLNSKARDSVGLIGDQLRHLGNRVEVNGHTDPEPVSNSIYPSNWELSLGRAMAVANALRGAGYRRPIDAFGLADSRFRDLSVRISAPRRYQLARRVDIIIRQDGGRDNALVP